MALSRMNAMQQLAAQQQQQTQAQNFQLQKLPYEAQIQAQSQAYQYGLQGQNQQQLAQLNAGLQDQASQRDFQEQMQLQTAHQQGQMQQAGYANQLQEGEQLQQLAMNPFAQHQQNVAQAQQQGYQFTPDQQTKVDQLKSDIGAVQQSVLGGQNTLGTAGPQLRQMVSQLNAITPSYKPQTLAQQLQQNVQMGLPIEVDDQGNVTKIQPGTENIPFEFDKKAQKFRVVDGFPQAMSAMQKGAQGATQKMPPQDMAIHQSDVKQITGWSTAVAKRTDQILDKAIETPGMTPINYKQARLVAMNEIGPPVVSDNLNPALQRQFEYHQHEYNQAKQAVQADPGLAQYLTAPIAPVQPQPIGAPGGGVVSQPPEAGIQNPEQAQPAAPVPLPSPDAEMTVKKLKSIPRDKWTAADWAAWMNVQAKEGLLQPSAGNLQEAA